MCSLEDIQLRDFLINSPSFLKCDICLKEIKNIDTDLYKEDAVMGPLFFHKKCAEAYKKEEAK